MNSGEFTLMYFVYNIKKLHNKIKINIQKPRES